MEKLINKLRFDAGAETHKRILGNVLQALEDSEKQPAKIQPNIWRKIMKSPIAKLAAAVVIIIAVLIVFSQFGASTPAFADIVRPLLTARTATYKMTVNMKDIPAQTIEGMFMDPSRMRQVMSGGNIQIFDMSQGQIMTLMPAVKKAMIVEMENIPEHQKGQINMFHAIRKLIQETEDESVAFIGEQKFDGVNAIGYHIGARNMGMTIWADATTLLPIRIEYSMGEMMGMEGTVIMSDFIFDVELDESLFEVPEEYDVHTMQLDVSLPGEEDFIQTLRLWSETTDGKFPSELNMKATAEFLKAFTEKEKTGLEFEKDKDPDLSDPQFKEFVEILTKINRGIMFAHTLPEDADWHYAGEDVKFGDADTAIFWYQPKDSQTYRVIYSDLSVKDVAPGNLPE
jgi:outer membrane lipoprotein-sorting protein